MPSLDNLLAATAANKATRPPQDQTISLNLDPDSDTATTVQLRPDDLTGQLSRVEELLTGAEITEILEAIEELATITRQHADDSAQPAVTAWLDEMQSLIDEVKSDMRDFAFLIRDEFIPAAATMRGEVDSMHTAANKALDTTGPVLPGESTGSAAFDTLNKLRTGQMDAQGYGMAQTYDPSAQIQRAYATMSALPHAMDTLVAGDYATAQTHTTAGAYGTNYPTIQHYGPQPHAQSAPAQSWAMTAPAMPQTRTTSGSMTPLAKAAAATGAIAHGVAKGLRGESGATTATSSGAAAPQKATSIPMPKKDAPAKGGVSRSELNEMIENAKKRIASERAAKRGAGGSRQLAQRRARPASTLGGGKTGSLAEKGSGKASFLDIASTTPGVARADSGTTAEKPTAAPAAAGGGGGGGGMRGGMGMMPMGGMMGAMNRAGNQNGMGKGGEGSGAVEVPLDYKLDEVGKSSSSPAVAGGVVRPTGAPVADEDTQQIVSPIQRGAADEEAEDNKGAKRGLGNIFG